MSAIDAIDAGEMGRWLLLGVLYYTATLLLMVCLTDFVRLHEVEAYLLVQLLLFSGSFLLTRIWVFRARRGSLQRQAGRYVASTLCFRLLNVACYWTFGIMSRNLACSFSCSPCF